MGRSFLLVIGINNYQSAQIHNLAWAVADARAFHTAAVRGRDPLSVESRLLLDGQATTVAIRDALGGWLARAELDDNVTVFFAGHGARELQPGGNIRTESEAYLLPADAHVDQIYATAVSLTHEIPVLLRRIRAGNITLIFDCCLSGAARSASAGTRSRGIDGPHFARMKMISEIAVNAAVTMGGGKRHEIGDGASILMACGANQAAMERDSLGHGVFTHYLLELMDEQRRQGRTSVSLGEVYAGVVKAVVSDTNADQVPMLEGRLSDQRLFIGC